MRPKYCLFLFLTLTILHQTSSIATIRYVSKTGTSQPPYTSWETAADSIQKCINICVDGDTIYVANGVYKENLLINTAISLIGSSMDSTVIDGTGLGSRTIDFVTRGELKNFKILSYGIGSGWAIRTYKYLKIADCYFTQAGLGIGGISSTVKATNLIMHNITKGFSLSCVADTCENLIENCFLTLYTNTSIGIELPFGGNNYIQNNIMLFLYNDNFESGITVGYTNSINIINNLISKFGNGISFDVVLDTAFVKNNIITHQSSSGSTGGIRSTGDILFVNNMILINNKKGIYGGGLVRSNYNIFWNNDINLAGTTIGDSDIVADPMLVKDTIPTLNGPYDFHLQAFSPGIDKGDPTILDLDGTRSDIGMYGGPFGETYTYQDLAPLAPRNLSAVVDSNYITVRWNRNTEADTSYYKVYRDTVINFTIDTTKLISSSADTFYVQQNPHNVSRYVYRITCVDNQENESLPSNELVVNITSVSTNDYPMTISDYVLYQNYPNPFNPNTKIGYQLKDRAYVKLMVYDIKGELVSVLVNKEQNSGYYEVEFVGNGLPSIPNTPGLASGIYLYRIEVIGEGKIPVYTEMKKMLLIK